MRILTSAHHRRRIAFVNTVSIGVFLVVLSACNADHGGADAPTITAQPQAVRVADGQPATFSVSVSGAAPLDVRWSRDGTAIAGATASSYTLATSRLGDDGATFQATVTNAAGRATSQSATLRVDPVAPSFAIDLVSTVAVTAGQPATFTTLARGSEPLTYQWRRSGVAIAGATTSIYRTAATVLADSGAVYDVVATNSAGTATSVTATLTVSPVPIAAAITVQPTSVVVGVGSAATFGVTAVGSPAPTYQWLRDGVPIAGAQSSSYTLPTTMQSDNGAQISVQVTNVVTSVTSTAAALGVKAQSGLALVAGDIGGYGTLDGKGSDARLSRVTGVSMDDTGNVIVAGSLGVQKVSPAGVVTTLLPSSADARTTAINPAGGLFLLDIAAIRKWDGKVVTPFAGPSLYTDRQVFSGPVQGVADAAGNLFVSDGFNHAIRKVTPDGTVTDFAGVPYNTYGRSTFMPMAWQRLRDSAFPPASRSIGTRTSMWRTPTRS